MEYTLREMMTIVAAREIKDGDIVFCGTGISMLAAMAAKNINAPNSVIFFETGSIDAKLDEIPLAVADPRVMYWASSNSGLLDAFATMQNRITGQHVIGILGAAQIDKYGNINSTVIGEYYLPKTRFSGSGGACDVASFVPRSITFMQHEKRKFVNKVDYLTSPGHLTGNGGREKAGLLPGGPQLVVTNMAVMRFDEETKEMYLAGYYPGVTKEEILENMEFDVDISRAEEVEPPTAHELKILREKCDPQRLIL
ncbi:MAG TPA: CoA-transferase [Syntrophales bacterium]|nr:CoA-transferase [Syntrophales bacterium]HPQ44947.1 CoA-transferase [Syntrophales bacterium]